MGGQIFIKSCLQTVYNKHMDWLNFLEANTIKMAAFQDGRHSI